MKNNYTLKFLKITLLFFALSLTSLPVFSQTVLTEGDIAFTRINIDDETLSFVLLVPIANSTKFIITDEAWNGSSLDAIESSIEFTATSDFLAGEEISIDTNILSFTSSGSGTASLLSIGAYSPINGNMLGAAGDNLFIYQSTGIPTATDFVAGINANSGVMGSPGNAWSTSTSSSNSLLPNGLTNGTDALGLFPNGGAQPEFDNARYMPTSLHTGDKATILASIMDLSNWEFDNDVPFPVSSATFNVTVPCTEPDIPTISYAPGTICDGNSALLNISGDLNDATTWYVYTGSCGGTLVGTTTGSSIIVTPTPPSTTYYVRGEGGCATAGSCGSVTITTTPREDASFSYSATAYCADSSDPTPTITGVSGGTFTSSGGLSLNATTGSIDVSASTPGAYTVTYSTSGLCDGSETASVTINTLPTVTFTAPEDLCLDAGIQADLGGGTATGGVYSGTGITDDGNGMTYSFDPAAAGVGIHTITYTLTNANGCTNAVSDDIEVTNTDAPSVDIITVGLTGDCAELSTGFTKTDILNGKNVYISNLDNFPLAVGFDGTKWVLFAMDIENTGFENTSVPAGLTPPLTGWVPTQCFDGTMDIYLGAYVCHGGTIADLSLLFSEDNIKIYVDATTETPLAETDLVINGNQYYISKTINGCESDRSVIEVTVGSEINNEATLNAGVITATQSNASYQWFACTGEGDEYLDGETGQSFTATEPGDYKVWVSVLGCSVESICITVSI
ncbi:hypothetical protein [Algibacter lectus]|uniref:hypothetical protein n=1 Tax=Algibacter lectus TaxID=221126 RepID=UPI0005A71B7B|nr:hypothetical protein [Algibacter lectus]